MWFGIGIYVCLCTYVCVYVRAHTHLECDSQRKFSSRLTNGAERSSSCKGKGHVFFPSVFILGGKSNLSAFQHLKGTASSAHCSVNSIGETSGTIFLGYNGGMATCRVVGFWKRADAETARTPSLHECLKANVLQNGDRVFLLSDGCVSLGNAVCTHGYVETE